MSVGFKGARQDLLIRQGADFGPSLGRIKNADGSPFDLSGCELSAVAAKVSTQPHPSFVFTVTITDAEAGEFELSATASQTAGLACGLTETDPKSQYLWQLDALRPGSKTTPIAYGQVAIFRRLSTE